MFNYKSNSLACKTQNSTNLSNKVFGDIVSMLNHFFKVPSSLGETEAARAPPKTPVIGGTIAEIVIEMAASTGIAVITCTRYEFSLPKMHLYQGPL